MQFCQTLRTSHLSLRAMAARVVALSEMAASVLNLIHPVGGGIHVCWTTVFVALWVAFRCSLRKRIQQSCDEYDLLLFEYQFGFPDERLDFRNTSSL